MPQKAETRKEEIMNRANRRALLSKGRGQLARFDAELAELENKLEQAKAVAADHIHLTVTETLTTVRRRMLAICEAVAPLVVGKTEAETEAIIHDAIVEALDELAEAAEAHFADNGHEARKEENE